MPFVLIAKSGDHKFLFKHLDDYKGRQHIYRWINDVALNGTTRAGKVNVFDCTIKAAGKTNFHSGRSAQTCALSHEFLLHTQRLKRGINRI